MTLPFANLSFPEIYEQALVGPLFRPFAQILVNDVAPRSGERALDIACGTGVVARLVRERVGPTGTVVGVDSAPPMLAVASKVGPGIEYRQGDGTALPLRDGEQFDVVLCHQGLQFFPDRAAGVREMHRALAPGGRLAVGTWGADEDLGYLRELRRIAERHAGPVSDRRHSLSTGAELEGLLRDAGFRDVRCRLEERTLRFGDGMVFARLNAMALVSMSARGKELDEQARARLVDAIVQDSEDVTRANSDQQGLAYRLTCNVATALR